MKAVNVNFHGTDNIKTSICWILSILAWSFYLGIGWTSIFLKDDFLWTLVRKTDLYIPFYGDDVYPYFPIQINKYFIYIIFCATLLISTIAFSAYLIYSICIKKTSVFNGMMGKITRFHFIPLFCASAIFMIGHFIEVNNKGLEIFRDIDINDINNIKDIPALRAAGIQGPPAGRGRVQALPEPAHQGKGPRDRRGAAFRLRLGRKFKRFMNFSSARLPRRRNGVIVRKAKPFDRKERDR